MTPREVLQRRLRRLAEEVQFRHYIVCPRCFAPIVLLAAEAVAPPTHFACDECASLIPSSSVGVLRYDPPSE